MSDECPLLRARQTYDIAVRTDDGTTVFRAFDVAWVGEFPGIAGVAFTMR